MRNLPAPNASRRNPKSPSVPPGKIKIAEALKTLLEEKDFNSITTAEIAKTSGVNEALIYRYFKDKRGLLHHLLAEGMKASRNQIDSDLSGLQGSFNKLRRLIWDSIDYYDRNRVFAKILLLEVRNFPGYFESRTYQLARQYSRIVLDLIKEGIANGEIRDDIPAAHVRNVIIGGIEHLCLPCVIFGREIPVDALTDSLCEIAFRGIVNREV
ncbi:MAG: TetR/AcrR family transcriptional regulator [Desulfobacterales bacterium]|nr:MAG: TetR/AcrR family transcriptional regulator [Desulfobacterales bacterium]